MKNTMGRWAAVSGAGLAALLAAASAGAQAPPGPEAAAIAQCLCMKQSLDRAGVEMTVRRRSLDQIRGELARLDADLSRERQSLNENDPQAVARFRQKLEQRDEMFRRSNGEIVADVAAAVKRYNDVVAAYNQRCAGRPTAPILLGQVQATLSCPGP
jgi:hypothetical protein